MWRIVLYRTARGDSPVEAFLDALPENHQRKVAAILEMLAERGPNLTRPYADHVRGPLRELRIQFGRNEYRLLYSFSGRDKAVLLHGFAKKTQKLPAREIEAAEDRRRDFEARWARGEYQP